MLLSVLALVAFVGCSRKGKIIPKDEFVDLLVEMFIADQWLRENGAARDRADTTLFFEPIFNKYGYSFKDYDATLRYFSGEVELLSEATYEAIEKMKVMKEHYAELVKRKAEITKKNEENMVELEDMIFYSDSTHVIPPKSLWPVREEPDSLILSLVDSSALKTTIQFSDTVSIPVKVKGFKLESAHKQIIDK